MSPDVTFGSVQAARNEKHSASQKNQEGSSFRIHANRLERMDTRHGIRPHIKLYAYTSTPFLSFHNWWLRVELMNVHQHRERSFVRVGVHDLEQRQQGL